MSASLAPARPVSRLALRAAPRAAGSRPSVLSADRAHPRASARAPDPSLRVSTTRPRVTSSAMPSDADASAPAGVSDLERYLFDLNGFLVVRGVFTPDEIAAANAAIDARTEAIVERKGDLRLGGSKGDPLAGDGDTGRADLGGMLGWPSPIATSSAPSSPIRSSSRITTPWSARDTAWTTSLCSSNRRPARTGSCSTAER